MNFKKHLETAWHLTLQHIGRLILMTLIMTVISFFTLGILSMVMLAGYTQSILLLIRVGRAPRIQDLFSEMHLFLPLLGFSILVFLAAMIGFMLFYLPGIAVICGAVFAFLYMLPLMTDQKLRLLEAMQKSWQMAVQDNIADHVVVVILFIGFMAIGGSVFLGTLFTQPFATLFVLSAYSERISTRIAKDSGKISHEPIDS